MEEIDKQLELETELISCKVSKKTIDKKKDWGIRWGQLIKEGVYYHENLWAIKEQQAEMENYKNKIARMSKLLEDTHKKYNDLCLKYNHVEVE